MREIPECLNRRYKALDQLVKELSTAITEHDSETECTPPGAKDPSIKLMCDFWNILKEDPECNLTQAVQQRMGLNTSSGVFGPRHLTCYMAGKGNKKDEDKMRDAAAKIKNICCKSSSESSPKPKCCASKSVSPSMGSDVLPLSKVLCNLKEAASFDKKCSARVNDLMTTEKQLQDQIQHLEHREKEGVKLLKQADCMWSCMEEAYKKKVAESLERQKTLLKQLKDVEGSAAKWRKNKKDLELQMTSINKCQQEINEKMNQKKNDIKCMDVEIADFKKRIENNKKEVEASKKSLSTKKQASDAKIATIAAEIKRLEKALEEEKRHKTNKEQEGNKYVKEARDDLQKMCKVLLQKKIENEDLRAEKQALLDEIELLKQTCEQCKEKCKNKQQSIIDEIKKVEKEIANFKVKCIRCHECTDTDDVRKFCTDCPKCLQERDCIYENDHCRPDQTMDCVCMSVKQKFLDNVFDNMYTVLERQVKTAPGKAVAEAVLNCLKRSRNGKLNEETRHILQEFILSTVKKNLNLTIVGGAVKTRCEMDPETYKQLMLCLKQVKAVRPPKADKGTAAKKESCRRWGGTSECNCPKGPKACICTRKAPRPPSDPTPCPEPDKEDAGEVVMCPHKESTACGPDCAMHAVPSCVGTELAAWKPDPCQGPSCPYSKNMRAAQCVLGPESLSSVQKTTVPIVPSISAFDDEITCRCKGAPVKPCECCKDTNQLKAENVKECHRNTCMIWEPVCKNIVDQEFLKESYDLDKKVCKNTAKDKNVTFQQSSTTNPFVVSLQKDKKKLNQLTQITIKPSGILTMELDENMVTSIEERTRDNPNISVSVKETEGGYFIIDFDPIDKSNKEKQNVTVKKSHSGNIYLEVHKYFIHKLSPNSVNQQDILNSNSSISIEIRSRKQFNEKSKHEHYSSEDIENDPSKIIVVEIQDDRGRVNDVEGIITETKSGYTALKIVNASIVKNVEERRVSLTQTDFGKYCLDLSDKVPNEMKNAILSKTSGGYLIISSQIKVGKKDPNIRNKTELFKIKVEDLKHNLSEPPALLKVTPSDNFILVLDREFEKWYKNTINDFIHDDCKCYVKLRKSESDEYIISLEDDEDTCESEHKALLVKSGSGNIKILVNDFNEPPTFVETQTSIEEIDTLLNELPQPRKCLRKSKFPDTRSSSDSQLYERVKLKLQDNEHLLAEPSALLKRTASGNYAVVLNKESKKTFINNLKKYLKSNSQDLIPIRKSDSGEITIELNDKHAGRGQYGSLRITPSGNIYVVIDEKVVNEITQNDFFVTSHHIMGTVRRPVDKSVATTCNAKPDCYCDVSKCVCKELKNRSRDWFYQPLHDKNKLFQSNDLNDCRETTIKKDNNHICDYKKCTDEKSCERIICDDEEGNSPHIVIKPNQCKPMFKKNPRSNEQCFFLIEAVCPYHKNRYDTVSNELLEISGPCNAIQDDKLRNALEKDESTVDVKDHSDDVLKCQSEWDSLSFLPPQLPAFLRDVLYK